jgi:hypothetical protein
MADLFKEIWINQIMEQYNADISWMADVEDMSEWVENNTINLAEAGVNPEVLINNTVYPVAFAERTDLPLALPLDYLDTEGTVIRNARKTELAYNKMASVNRGHSVALQQMGARRAAYFFSPAADDDNTPVLPTSGGDNGAGLCYITEDDILQLSSRFDDINAPRDQRVLVLHSKHLNELAKNSATLKAQQAYQGAVGSISKEVGNLFGFKIWVYNSSVVYNRNTGAKPAFGAAAAGTDAPSSFAFVKGEVMKAIGDYDFFYRLNDPEQKGDIINYQQRFVALPKRNKYIGAIYSAAV